MSTFALIENGIVTNIAVGTTGNGQWVQVDALPQVPSIGWTYVNGAFSAPVGPQWSDPHLDPRYWWITRDAFVARLGVNAYAIAASQHDVCRAAQAVLTNSTYVDLKGTQVSNALNLLVSAGEPVANTNFTGSGPLTASQVNTILGPPTLANERYIAGMPQPQ